MHGGSSCMPVTLGSLHSLGSRMDNGHQCCACLCCFPCRVSGQHSRHTLTSHILVVLSHARAQTRGLEQPLLYMRSCQREHYVFLLCRYPAFVDALRDLDDPLTMTHLFATLPAEANHDIPAKVVANARRLSMEFQAYVVRAHALRKVFVSVKGFYYQADIQGQAVTWLVPHNLAQASFRNISNAVSCISPAWHHVV